ncbi:MAG TPA: protein kinase [Bryobacteraceae bacterium]|nr:protein kinase [Bryobacteraceae bacterium]
MKNRYQLRERLGTGGMGIVYRARDIVINADIALKTLTDTTDPIALRMFREECDKLAKIIHPNVVEIRDTGEIEENGSRKPYMVMPFLRGKTLDRLLLDSQGGLPLDRALEILVQASRGLQATHEAGLIHRDIKPSNLFVLDDDSVKLIDFGVAHYAENLLTLTRKGTLMYMAPEQVMMQGTSPLSDIFSLGVVAYETLTGRRPFEGRTEKDLIDSIVQRNPMPASCFNSQLNSAIDQTLQKALAKLPKYRFQSAREFGDTLRKAILNHRIAMFDPARIEQRIEQARNSIARGDLDTAGDIIHQLELQGWLDERIEQAKQDFEHLRNQQAVRSLLDMARSQTEAQEYAPAAKSVEEALQLAPNNAEAISLRQEIERRVAEGEVAERLATARLLAENRQFDEAKEAVEQTLEICPNEPAALELRSSIQRSEQEYGAVLNEKRRATRRAEHAMEQSNPARAWTAIQYALDLDRQAPEAGDGGPDLLHLSNRILAASQDAQKSLDRARDFCRSGQLDAALACCDEVLGRLPEHNELRALKLDIEETQTRQTADRIAAAEREIEAEPDLDRRIVLLKSAAEQFSRIDHFASRYRVAREKRDFAERLAVKARAAEQERRLEDALETWKFVRWVHPDCPGLEAEIARLRRRDDLQTDYERREDLLRQIKLAIEAHEFTGALHVIHMSATAFPGDQAFAELLAAAENGAERERLAGHFLDWAAQLEQQHLYEAALSKLDEASTLDVRSREITATRRQILVEQARCLPDTEWRHAIALLRQAVELAPGNENSKRLLELLEERGRRERINEATDRIRRLERTHDFDGALLAAEQALAENPENPELAQTAARLKQRGDRAQPGGQPSSSSDAPRRVFLWGAWEKAAALAHRSRASSASVRQRVIASSSARDASAEGGGIVFAEETPPNTAAPSTPRPETPRRSRAFRPRGIHGAPLAFLGGAVAISILLVLLLPRRHTTPVPVVPHRAAVPPPSVSPASLQLRVDPLDAQVTVDGSPASLRNGVLAVHPGTHVLEVRSPGYEPLSRSVEIAPRDNDALDIALVPVPLPPVIHVETDLQSGSVFMDDKPAGVLDGGQFFQDAPAGSHIIAILGPSGGRYSFAFTLGKDPIWNVDAPKSTAYGTPVLTALSSTGARIVCGRSGLAFELDDGQAFACTKVVKDLPPLAKGNHTLTLLEGTRTIAVHTLEYQGTPVLAALITTGAQFGGLAIRGTEETFNISVNGHTSKRPAKGGHWRRLLKPGDYTVSISKPGFNVNPSTLSVSITPGVDTVEQISFTQVPEHAHLRLQSQPGTEVSLNGKLAGLVPEGGILDLAQLTAGTADLHLHHKGFADVDKTITLANGENQRAIVLQELKSKITWTVDPPNTLVTYSMAGESLRHHVNGNSIEVPAGTYNFEASTPGRQAINSVVTVGPGEARTLALRLNAANPVVRNIDSWPGWDMRGGWLVREKPGTVFQTLPQHASHVTFTAQWERSKTLVHWSGGGTLNLVFRTADSARSIGFRITEHGVAWSVTAQGQRREGRIPLNLAKNPETIEADISSSGIALTINGAALPAVGANLSAESKPLEFGFIIDQDQTVRLEGLRVTIPTGAEN